MRVSLGHLLPALLLCIPAIGYAEVGQSGDFWTIHQKGDRNNHEVFVVDGDPLHVVRRADGVAAVEVHQVYEGIDTPVMTTYAAEIDCSGRRIRLQKATELQWDMVTSTPVKVSTAWQTTPDAWLAQTRDFFCQPGERAANGMKHLGWMGAIAMVDNVRKSFVVVQREDAAAPVMKMIDDAFERMPRN